MSVALIIMTGSPRGTPAENMVAEAREAITLDLVARAVETGVFAPIIVSTDSPTLAARLAVWPVLVELDPPNQVFHFGQHLQELIRRYELERVLYMGGGSAPLLPATTLAAIAQRLDQADQLVLTNNFYSSDFVAFTPASVLLGLPPISTDNDLSWQLGRHFGRPAEELPRRAATQLDVDTPVDLMTLSLHPAVGGHTRSFLKALDLPIQVFEAVLPLLTDRRAEILIAGRVSSTTWHYLERETACRVRCFAEERGMRASSRQWRGEVRSLLGFYLDQVGPARFFETLAQLAQAVFLDNRVLLAHRGLWPSAADRFNSDLRRPEEINDPFLRELTAAAIAAPVPVIMGGHSLVSGGMYALVEAAWARGRDVPRQVAPVPWPNNKI